MPASAAALRAAGAAFAPAFALVVILAFRQAQPHHFLVDVRPVQPDDGQMAAILALEVANGLLNELPPRKGW